MKPSIGSSMRTTPPPLSPRQKSQRQLVQLQVYLQNGKVVVRAVVGLSLSLLLVLCCWVGSSSRSTAPTLLRSTAFSSVSTKRGLSDALLKFPSISAELVWDQLVSEGAHQMKTSKSKIGVAMEVGMHRAKQCLQAATAGLQAHCVEPSPTSFQRVANAVAATGDATVQERVHLYQAAAGQTSDASVDFVGTGTTGDHVGDFDVWNMKAGKPQDEALAKKQGDVMKVSTIALDDIIHKNLKDGEDKAFLLKVDTQGYEPAVLSGLTKSLASRKVSFVLLEYWPAGMDLIMSQPSGTCVAATLVQQLLDAGYTVYALPASCHPMAPTAAKEALTTLTMPLDSVTAHCQWFYDVARRYPSETYKMGYWSDVLAVAPNLELPAAPVTDLAKVLLGASSRIANQ
jgi:FkbM family methyltransferase